MTRENANEPPMPANWSPESDRDPAWEAIMALAKDADRPTHPTEARYAEMLQAIRAEAFPDPIVPAAAAPVREDSFGAWARTMLLGGGPGAQLLRMAAVGGLVWVAASTTTANRGAASTASAAAPMEVAAASSSATSSADRAVDIDADGDLDAYFSQPAVRSAGPVPHATVGSPTMPEVVPDRGAGVVLAIPDSQPNLLAFNWSGLANDLDTASDGSTEYRLRSASLPGGGNSVGGFGDAANFPVTLSNSATGAGELYFASARPAQSTPGALQDLVNQIQQLKFESYMDQDREVLDRIRRMESSVSRLMESDESLSSDNVAAIETFQRGEQLLAGKRYGDAVAAFRDVRRLAPGTFLAFLAQYQIAGTSFVYMRDYDSALEGYNKTLKEYPAHFISSEHNDHIRKRIEMLTQNRANDWRAVDLWQDARLSGPEARVVILRELIQSYPESPLAADAAMSLLEMAVAGGTKPGCIEPVELIALCETAVDDAPETNHVAVLQFVKAETIFRRLFDLERADAEFRRALTMPGADAIADQIQVRLNQIAQRGRGPEGKSGNGSGVEKDSRPS